MENLPQKIEVFTNEQFQITPYPQHNTKGMKVQYFNLDYPNKLPNESELPKAKWGDPKAWEAWAIKKVQTSGHKAINPTELEQQIQVVLHGRQQVTKYQIKFIPAIIFDNGESVVYGTTEVAEAIRLYQIWKAKQTSSSP